MIYYFAQRLALGGVQPRAQSALPFNENAVTPLTLSASVPVVARWADAGQYSPQSHLHTSVAQSNLFTGPPQLYPMKQVPYIFIAVGLTILDGVFRFFESH